MVYWAATNLLHSFFADTGREDWTFPFEGSASQPIVSDGVVYFGTYVLPSEGEAGAFREGQGVLHAISASMGRELWAFSTEHGIYSAPAAARGMVYVSSGDTVYALTAAEGREIWRFTDEMPALVGMEGSVADLRSHPPEYHLTAAEDIVHVGSTSGWVHALASQTGQKLSGPSRPATV